MGFRRASSVLLQEALSQSQAWTFLGDLRFFSQNAFFFDSGFFIEPNLSLDAIMEM